MENDTLLIRHLPQNLSDEQKYQLLQHFGVVEFKSLAGQVKKSNVVFARFESVAAASIALKRLHQLDVLGYPLNVEYARGRKTNFATHSDKPQPSSTTAKEIEDEKQKLYDAFMNKLNSWNAPLNFCQPPPPHLKYQYPPPNREVLTNISRAMASVPKFYTQVLHLMNRMNLPSPFEFLQPTHIPDVCGNDTESVLHEESREVVMQDVSTEEESEMESDAEASQKTDIMIPAKRIKSQPKRVVKRSKFMRPTASVASSSTRSTKPEEVFDIVECEPAQRKIELKITGETADKLEDRVEELAGGFGLLFPLIESKEQDKTENSNEVEDPAAGSTISGDQLAANRIPSRDQKHLPVFKNYQPGVQSCRLYIKNLSKQVVERDLHFIYRRYLIPDHEEQGSMFDVRLMKEGRMKGQAFVTLQNTKQAQLALNETNGFILKDKPLVVQFARSAKASEVRTGTAS